MTEKPQAEKPQTDNAVQPTDQRSGSPDRGATAPKEIPAASGEDPGARARGELAHPDRTLGPTDAAADAGHQGTDTGPTPPAEPEIGTHDHLLWSFDRELDGVRGGHTANDAPSNEDMHGEGDEEPVDADSTPNADAAGQPITVEGVIEDIKTEEARVNRGSGPEDTSEDEQARKRLLERFAHESAVLGDGVELLPDVFGDRDE